MAGASPSSDAAADEPGAESASEAPSLLEGAVDAAQARRAALVVAGAARDLEEARVFLAMLGLDDLSRRA